MTNDKQAIASRLKDAIEWYASCTAEGFVADEQAKQTIHTELDRTWNEIIDLITDLAN